MTVKDLLSDESKWTQDCYARDAFGMPVDFKHPEAVRWCLAGAIHRCLGHRNALRDEIPSRVVQRLGMSCSEWNDAPDRTFAEVKAFVEELDI